MERGVRQRERWPQVVREHEHRGAERRIVAPPALPFVVSPRSPLRPELVAAHDLGADVVAVVAGEVVVEPAGAAGVGAVDPARSGSRPCEEGTRLRMPEGPFQRLTLT